MFFASFSNQQQEQQQQPGSQQQLLRAGQRLKGQPVISRQEWDKPGLSGIKDGSIKFIHALQ
jgi:hypothetical protein